MPAAPRRLLRAGDGSPQHDGVRAARDRAREVAAAPNAPVRDDVHVATTGLVHVVAPGRRHVRDRRRHRRVYAQRLARRVRRSPAKTDEDAGRARAHQVQGRRVRAHASDDDGDVQLVDEALEVEGLAPRRHVLGGHCGAANNEQVDARVHDRAPMLLDALGRELAGDDHAGLAQLLEPLRDQRGLDRLRIDALEGRDRLLLAQVSDLIKNRGGILVAGPQSVQIQDADATEATKSDRGFRAHHRVHGGGHQGNVDVVGVDLPADVNVLGVARAPGGHERYIVQCVGAPTALAASDFDFVAHEPILLPRGRRCARPLPHWSHRRD